MNDLLVITDIPREKVKDLQALVTMLPDNFTGAELHCYLQLVLAAFSSRDYSARQRMMQMLVHTENQLAIMIAAGIENFPEKE